MGQVIRLISKHERERIRLIQEARAIYDGIFPPVDLVNERRDKASDTARVVNARRSDEAWS
jgi:hypothetical protein